MDLTSNVLGKKSIFLFMYVSKVAFYTAAILIKYYCYVAYLDTRTGKKANTMTVKMSSAV